MHHDIEWFLLRAYRSRPARRLLWPYILRNITIGIVGMHTLCQGTTLETPVSGHVSHSRRTASAASLGSRGRLQVMSIFENLKCPDRHVGLQEHGSKQLYSASADLVDAVWRCFTGVWGRSQDEVGDLIFVHSTMVGTCQSGTG